MDRVRKRIQLDELGQQSWQKYGITVAVLDSGISQHPDLQGKCMHFKDFVNEKSVPYDDNGHGTHVCGILCGSGEASQGQFRGIAPSCRLVVCKVLDKNGDGSADVMLEALQWLLENHKKYDIRIINISVGIGKMHDRNRSRQLTAALEKLWDAGVIIICAAGNKGPRPGSISNIGGMQKVITVGCYDDLEPQNCEENCERYSGRGPQDAMTRKPDLVAPGTGIISCNHGFVRILSNETHNQNDEGICNKTAYKNLYVAKTGTSMATPIVTGCAALLLQKEPYLTNEKVKERLQYSAQDLGKPWNWQGWGMVNVKNLLEIN